MGWWTPIFAFFTNIFKFNPKKIPEDISKETIVNQPSTLEKQQVEAIDAQKTLALKQQALMDASAMAGGKRKNRRKKI